MAERFLLLVIMASVTESPFMILASTLQDPLLFEREVAAHRWSPLVWLHPSEAYFPSSVPFFLRHITPSTTKGHAEGSRAPGLNLPSGRPSRNFYLLAPHNFECLDCTLPGFLHGQKPQKKYSPPVYVTIHTCPSLSSSRAVRNTLNSLTNDKFISLNTYNNIPDDVTTMSISQADHRPTFSVTNTTMQQNISSLSTDSTYLLPNIFSQINQTQPRKIHSSVSTLEARNSQYVSYEENTTTSFSVCISNGTLCHKSTSREKTHTNMTKIQTADDSSNLDTRNIRFIDNILLNTTVTPYMNESQFTQKYFTKFLNSSEPQNNTQVDDTNDLRNNTKLTSIRQYRNNEEQHPRAPSNKDRLLPSEQQYTVTYWMFYPYNRGKNICTINLGFFGQMFKVKVNGVCYGEEITLGNHVGDWEHVSIKFKGSKPTHMYVSAHTFGAYYTYDATNNRFIYEYEDTREGIPMSPVYPKIIHLSGGSHPILYSARGSHGLWGAEGTNQYNSLPLLQDETGKGTPWKIWKNLKLIDVQDPLSMQPYRHWWKYEGRWGNPSSKCHVLLAGLCEHVKGPTGIPRKRVNFPCQNI
ncbi:uncharacterized protein LOC135111735 isoform X1 [Scylla paramamosain]|uniref:uncharacterized protein LOC135111735 isoform X1 n=1 Tax=Scylla paramamosain TaxID=85552 RepID=UPI00308356FF